MLQSLLLAPQFPGFWQPPLGSVNSSHSVTVPPVVTVVMQTVAMLVEPMLPESVMAPPVHVVASCSSMWTRGVTLLPSTDPLMEIQLSRSRRT